MELDRRAQVDLWRQKVLDGSITDEELREAVRVTRAGRVAASEAGIRNRQAKGPMKTGDELLAELDEFVGPDIAEKIPSGETPIS